MSKFIQLHLLTSYAPANLNRDDLGRPKTARMGGTERLRVSSQSLKRHWRTSDIFADLFGDLGERNLGIRTKRIGERFVFDKLISSGVKEEKAMEWSENIQMIYGTPDEKSEYGVLNSELVFLSKKEEEKLSRLVNELVLYLNEKKESEIVNKLIELVNKYKKAKDKKKAKSTYAKAMSEVLLEKTSSAVDIALFGRMLASSPDFNTEAACQVAHAISVHSVAVEDDYFTAVDDLNRGDTDLGAAHIGEAAFAAALFYSYVCIDKELLIENLGGDQALASKALGALLEAAVKVSPKGKQNSFASRAYASYVLAEKGDQQPRSLSVAFLKPVAGENQAEDAIKALERQCENFDKVYGPCADVRQSVNALTGEGSFAELKAFVAD